MIPRPRTFLTPISMRVLAFNALIVFVPIAGVLSLDTYEKQLLKSLERSLVQQGRVLAAALEGSGPGLKDNAMHLVRRLRQRHDARIRVVDSAGRLVADSASIARPAEDASDDAAAAAAGAPVPEQTPRAAQETFLYRLASFPVRIYRKYLRPPQPPTESDEFYSGARVLDGPEIKDALGGNYGAETRITAGQQSVTLYCAIPVRMGESVIGVVLVSQTTYRMLSDLYALRLDIFRLFLWSVGTAVVLSLLVSATITVPIRRLRDQAYEILDPRGRLRGGFVPSRARDEVGELSRSLGELTGRLEKHMRLVESFASDVSHELKNPLASIRAAAEIAQSSEDPEERRGMLTMVLQDVSRMERLLTSVREISHIDSGAATERTAKPVDARAIAAGVVDAARLRVRGAGPGVELIGGEASVWVPPGRLQQVLENLLDNAMSFSPPAATVTVSVERRQGEAVVRVSDEGPGIPAEHRDKVFERFFSFRPDEEKGTHAGLGLSIVKSIVESYGGSVRVASDGGPGACFEVRLPAA